MVKLEEVMDEEFVREQEGPHDEDEWDTDSGTSGTNPLASSIHIFRGGGNHMKEPCANAPQNPTWNPNPLSSQTRHCTSASAR